MIASAIKNGLILILIILIFHFFLKNQLYDQELEDDETEDKEEFENTNVPTTHQGDHKIRPRDSSRTAHTSHAPANHGQGLLSPQDVKKGLKKVNFQDPKPVEDAQLFNPMKNDDLFQFILEGEKKVKNDCEAEMFPASKLPEHHTDGRPEIGPKKDDATFSKPFDQFFDKKLGEVEPANNEGPESLDDLFKSTQVSQCP